MSQRNDLYGECNVNQAPVEVFSEMCCKRCLNPECSRSSFGGTAFDKRVHGWFEKLFSNVARMDARDPRFQAISQQGFHTIDLSRMPEVRTSDWIDPRDLVRPAKPTGEGNSPLPQPPNPSPPAAESVALPIPADQPKPPEIPVVASRMQVPKKSTLPRQVILGNAPSQSGKVLPGAPPAGSSPTESGSWKSGPLSVPQDANVQVVAPGAKVKFES